MTDTIQECPHRGWQHTCDGTDWCAWCEIDRLELELTEAKGRIEALEIELDGCHDLIFHERFDG